MKILDTVRSALTQPKVVRPATTLTMVVGLAAIGAGTAALMGYLDLSQASAIGTISGGVVLFAVSADATARRRKTTVRVVTCDLEKKEMTVPYQALLFETALKNPAYPLANADIFLLQKTGKDFFELLPKESFSSYKHHGKWGPAVMWKTSRFGGGDLGGGIGLSTGLIELKELSSGRTFHFASSDASEETFPSDKPYEGAFSHLIYRSQEVQIMGVTHAVRDKVATHEKFKVITEGESHIAWRCASSGVAVTAVIVPYSNKWEFSDRPPLILDFTLTNGWLAILFGR